MVVIGFKVQLGGEDGARSQEQKEAGDGKSRSLGQRDSLPACKSFPNLPKIIAAVHIIANACLACPMVSFSLDFQSASL